MCLLICLIVLCPTLNNAVYSSTIFCWNTSGRACCVRGEGSMLHGDRSFGRGSHADRVLVEATQ